MLALTYDEGYFNEALPEEYGEGYPEANAAFWEALDNLELETLRGIVSKYPNSKIRVLAELYLASGYCEEQGGLAYLMQLKSELEREHPGSLYLTDLQLSIASYYRGKTYSPASHEVKIKALKDTVREYAAVLDLPDYVMCSTRYCSAHDLAEQTIQEINAEIEKLSQ